MYARMHKVFSWWTNVTFAEKRWFLHLSCLKTVFQKTLLTMRNWKISIKQGHKHYENVLFEIITPAHRWLSLINHLENEPDSYLQTLKLDFFPGFENITLVWNEVWKNWVLQSNFVGCCYSFETWSLSKIPTLISKHWIKDLL